MNILDLGRRRDVLTDRFRVFLDQGFRNRILSFDQTAAHIYGELMSHRRSIGKPMSVLDGQIAAIARNNGMHVATRDIGGFEDTGLELIDPWHTDEAPGG